MKILPERPRLEINATTNAISKTAKSGFALSGSGQAVTSWGAGAPDRLSCRWNAATAAAAALGRRRHAGVHRQGGFANLLNAVPVHVITVNAAMFGTAVYRLEQMAQT